jgi:hypothetical protein
MDTTRTGNEPVDPAKSSEQTTDSSDRRLFIKGIAATTMAVGGLAINASAKSTAGSGSIAPASCGDPPLARFSKAILREIPLAQVGGYLSRIGSLGPLAFGNACGNGCGSGCGNNCLSAVDVSGYTELTLQQLNEIAADRAGLRNAVLVQIQNMSAGIGSG